MSDVSAKLTELLGGLTRWAESQHKYLKGEAFAPTWALEGPVDIVDSTKTGDTFNDAAFDGNLLLQQHKQRNPYWNAMRINLQINLIATLERSFRGRHMSPICALYSLAGRQEGQEALINADL